MINLNEDFFCVLDLGHSGVRAIGAEVLHGKIQRIRVECYDYDSTDMESFLQNASTGIAHTVDRLEDAFSCRYQRVWVSGNFGPIKSRVFPVEMNFESDKKVTPSDVIKLISSRENILNNENEHVLHVIPTYYIVDNFRDLNSIVGMRGSRIGAIFHSISAGRDQIRDIASCLRRVHLESEQFLDVMMVVGSTELTDEQRENGTLIIDLGAGATHLGIWFKNRLVYSEKIPLGGNNLTETISDAIGVNKSIAERLKLEIGTAIQNDMDAFKSITFSVPDESGIPTERIITRSEITSVISDWLVDLFDTIDKHLVARKKDGYINNIVLMGGGAKIGDIETIVQNIFDKPTTILSDSDLVLINSLYKFVWGSMKNEITDYENNRQQWDYRWVQIKNWFEKHLTPKNKIRLIKNPVMPSTLAFDMTSEKTYQTFRSGKIDTIHVDVMDGMYVENTASGISEIASIRKMTDAHLHVHLMVNNPMDWIESTANAGADSILISMDTDGAITSLNKIKSLKLRCGVALHPNSPLSLLLPILPLVDEVMIMSVIPGSGGQPFIPTSINRITKLRAYREKHKLSFKISVDGGINADSAPLCWASGADLLVAGSFLAKSESFPSAVRQLLPKKA